MTESRLWLELRVVLVSGQGAELDPPPGRVLITAPTMTFADLAEAIDTAFARYDRSHLHRFELADGRTLYSDEESAVELDGAGTSVETHLQDVPLDTLERFSYVFDFGDDWRHEVKLVRAGVDPHEVWGAVPDRPVVLDGWGWIPDQYGREEDEPDE